MDEFQEILQDFLVEAFELIEQLDQDLVELENNPDDLDLLNRIFRVAHTIKGSSSFLNFDVLTRLTHHMEDVLNKARKEELKVTPEVMDVVLPSIDMMKGLLAQIRDTGTDEGGIDIEEIVQKLDAISKGEDPSAGGGGEAPTEASSNESSGSEEKASENKEGATVNPDDPLADEPELDYSNMSEEEIEKEIERLLKKRQEADRAKREAKKKAEQGGGEEKKPEQKAPAPQQSKPAAPKPAAPKPASPAGAKKPPAKPAVEQTIRVDVRRLDHLMNLIGELVLGKNRLMKINDDVEERYEGEEFLEELNQVVSMISLVTTDLQIAVMKTRMLPIGKVFNKFPRMIRDLSRELNKKIELRIEGEETELDKSIVEEIGDPLVHIIRNSCDHGIETPEERAAKGKPETGVVELKAYNEGNHIVIQITDDGKGMDPEVLKQKSIEKGILSEKEAAQMTDKEAFGLIFRPGFSTAAKVTNVSGRGVGMDVVKTNIEKLNGIIDIESEVNVGTTMKLKIPLTLAIIQALLVGVQEEYYAIPLASVLETVRITPEEIYTVENRQVLRLRDEVLSLVHLADIFDVERVFENQDHTYVVVLGLAESKIGVIVDSLVGQEEIVIKNLGEYLKGMDGIAGATIRGDGGVTLIVDVAAIMNMAKEIKSQAVQVETTQSKPKNGPEDYVVMIVDDSKTDRKIMKSALKPLGVQIIEATDGVDALTKLKSGEYDIDAVMVDIEMPRMDGYTLATEIRKYNKFKNLPLLAVTSRNSKSDRMRGVEAGMSEYITKPYSPEYIVNVVRRNLGLD
ncbi:MAG TPA: hybrid sensor histidine kinase/response regulator [Campylobacterales bacterium]|nr:hybrid sensor histidine kinase/response regulator [Campylobacterales bacterium]